MRNQDEQHGGSNVSPTDTKDAKNKASKLISAMGILIGLLGVFLGPVVVIGAAVIVVVGVLYGLQDTPKACEVEILESSCKENWLQKGKHLCTLCEKQEDCSKGDDELSMWDVPVGAAVTKDSPSCKIKISYLGGKCSDDCKYPQLVIIEPK